MPKQIVIRWDEASIRGYKDLLPADVVRSHKNGSVIEHEVRGPHEGHYGFANAKSESGSVR